MTTLIKEFTKKHINNLQNWATISDNNVIATKEYIKYIINNKIGFDTITVEKMGFNFLSISFNKELKSIESYRLIIDINNKKCQLINFNGNYKDERDLFTKEFPEIPDIISCSINSKKLLKEFQQNGCIVGYDFDSICHFYTEENRLFIYGGCSDGEINIWDYETGINMTDNCCFGTDKINNIVQYRNKKGEERLLFSNTVGNVHDYFLKSDGRINWREYINNYNIIEGFNDRIAGPLFPIIESLKLLKNGLLVIAFGDFKQEYNNIDINDTQNFNRENSNKIIIHSLNDRKNILKLGYHGNNRLTSLDVYSEDNYIVSCDETGKVIIYNFDNKEEKSFETNYELCSLCISKDKKIILGTLTNDILLYNIEDCQFITSWKNDINQEKEEKSITCLLSKDNYIISCSGYTAKIWDLNNYKCLQSYNKHTDDILAIHIMKNSIILTSECGSIHSWKINI